MANIPLPMTALYAGMLGIMLVVLGMMVIRERLRSQVELLDGGVAQMARAIRVHGNLAEYLPTALILMAAVELNGAPQWALHSAGTVLLVSRLIHAYGLWRSSGASPGRFIGTVGTFVVIFAGAVYAVVQYNGYVQAL